MVALCLAPCASAQALMQCIHEAWVHYLHTFITNMLLVAISDLLYTRIVSTNILELNFLAQEVEIANFQCVLRFFLASGVVPAGAEPSEALKI